MTTREDLAERASGMAPAGGPAPEERRQPLAENVAARREAGIIHVAPPERYGGLDLDSDAVFDISAELGRGCGSTAWRYRIWARHDWLMGRFPKAAQDEYWADTPDTRSSTSFNPARGRAAAAPGGYRPSGPWGGQRF